MSWKVGSASGRPQGDGRLKSCFFRSAVVIAVTAASVPVTSCAYLGDLFLMRAGFEDDAANVPGSGEITSSANADEKRGSVIEPERRDRASEPLAPAAPLPSSAAATGVAAKFSEPFAQVRRQLARLARSGSIGELHDGALSKEVSDISDGYFVQIGAHQVPSAAEGQRGAAKAAFSLMISSFDLRVRPADVSGQGRFFRVQIGPISSQGAALDLCRALQAKNQDCFMIAGTTADKAPARGQVALAGEWASIGPGEGRTDVQSSAEIAIDFAARGKPRQVADAAPLFTAPGLPGLPE